MKKWLNQRAFTLIEMLVVLLVISIVLLVAIPNISKHSESINDKGCQALKQMLEGQIHAYHVEKNEYPQNIAALKAEGYLNEEHKLECPGGTQLTIDDKGNVMEETN